MRVIAGSARGRTLKGPPARRRGDRSGGARPSSDLVRGAVFSALDAMGADYTRVLDLYAGTGALGIEALSRGAGWCDFVERGRAMADVIRENLRVTGFDDRAKVYSIAAGRVLDGVLEGAYTLVLADPPYADAGALELMERLGTSALVSPENTTIVLEHSTRNEPPADLGDFRLEKMLRHGDSAVSIFTPAPANER
jgi:16S rRNA (guanine966-N2)-methyltransferase